MFEAMTSGSLGKIILKFTKVDLKQIVHRENTTHNMQENILDLSIRSTFLTSLRFASTIKTKSLKLSLLVVTHIVAQIFFKK